MKHSGGSNCCFIFTHKNSQGLTKDFHSICLGKIREKCLGTCSVTCARRSQNGPQVRVLYAVRGGSLLKEKEEHTRSSAIFTSFLFVKFVRRVMSYL